MRHRPNLGAALGLAIGLTFGCGSDDDDDAPPPPVIASPSSVTVVANSTPTGAAVTGGGRALGITPLTTTVPVPPAQPGQVQTFTFTFAMPGYQPASIDAAPVDGTISVNAALAPLPPPSPVAVAAPAAAPTSAAGAPAPRPRPPARPVVPPSPFREGDRWRGNYVCQQGPTDLTLRITGVNGDRISAVFEFNYRPRGISGSFRNSGTYDRRSRRLALRPGAWIRRPSGWSTVGMTGRVNESGRVYSGRITGAQGCTTFTVRR